MANTELENQSLEEIIASLRALGASEDRMERSKEADALKSEFYKILSRQKAEAEEAGINISQKFTEAENAFKQLFADYKRERAEYNKTQDELRAGNLKAKQAIIEELKALVESPLDEVGSAFPKLRELQQRWRDAGPVPSSDFRFINETYQFLVEKFYDMVQINHDLRDLDFKKNLEAKTALCEEAEKLAQQTDIVASFKALQKLHDQWKEYGPVEKELRDAVWERFKASTTEINKKYQDHFETLKQTLSANLDAKTALCEKVEAISGREDVADAGTWNSLAKEIEQIQAEWKTIGFATKKDNQKIYDRFRAACDAFYAKKKEFFSNARGDMDANIAKKEALIAQAAALKDSTDWKATTDQFISLQKQWKEVGAIPRKKADQLWKRFREECDYFFAQKEKLAKPENDFYGNLKAKKAIIAEILAYNPAEGADASEAAKAFEERFAAIGHVPFKEKDNIAKAFKDAMREKFPQAQRRPQRSAGAPARAPRDPRADLIRKYHALEQEIATLENNMGFFSASKNSGAFIAQIQAKVDAAKAELAAMEEQIRNTEVDNG